jgi:hypothetical protein
VLPCQGLQKAKHSPSQQLLVTVELKTSQPPHSKVSQQSQQRILTKKSTPKVRTLKWHSGQVNRSLWLWPGLKPINSVTACLLNDLLFITQRALPCLHNCSLNHSLSDLPDSHLLQHSSHRQLSLSAPGTLSYYTELDSCILQSGSEVYGCVQSLEQVHAKK